MLEHEARRGMEAGCLSKQGNRSRWVVTVNHVELYRHLIVWALHHGEWKLGVDHRDRDRSSTTESENLRPATGSLNLANAPTYSNNTSGYKGVSWHKRHEKWVARIMANQKAIQSASFDRPDDAHIAYAEAARQHFGGIRSHRSCLTHVDGFLSLPRREHARDFANEDHDDAPAWAD